VPDGGVDQGAKVSEGAARLLPQRPIHVAVAWPYASSWSGTRSLVAMVLSTERHRGIDIFYA
jgi:hypothetical protein